MVYKKGISILISFLIVFGNVIFPRTVVRATTDTTPPTLNNITVDKKTVTSGDRITVTVDANDDISGIKNIDVFYYAPSGSATKYASLSKNTDGKYRTK